ncbi:MAG TPA: type II secretion system F family protein [Caldithrix abyssi]|uniref:Type II secretion system F family protein n=1 Tax=Caldithrix abyssi TaxID=187145 RepID=A0A7V5RQ83_CALAY|nr:type II secretion system F family protein [Caldithrix abyssi]
MPNFKYKAINSEGKTVESVILAADQKVVLRQLQKLKMTPVSITIYNEKKKVRTSNKRVDVKSILMFTKQLFTLLKAGIPIVTCLKVIGEQSEEPGFKQMVGAITSDIEAGSKLSDALAQFPKAFPPLYVNSVRVGEVSGTLEDTLEQLGAFMEEDDKIRKAVKKALRYPSFVMVGLAGAFVVFTTLVIPNFMPLFEMSGQEMPFPTRVLMGFYYLFTDYGLLLAVGLAMLGMALAAYFKTPAGRYNLDLLRLKLPIMGKLVRKLNISRFAKLLYTMNSTGISILRSFEIIQDTMDNQVYKKEVEGIRDRVSMGESIAQAIKQSSYFDNLLIIMVNIGERSGSLDDMLGNVSEHYYREVGETVENLTSMIEPVVTVVLGIMMLFFALAIFLPMWGMINAF